MRKCATTWRSVRTARREDAVAAAAKDRLVVEPAADGTEGTEHGGAYAEAECQYDWAR